MKRGLHSECRRKKRHATSTEADDALRKMVARDGDRSLHVYACLFCGGFHVGHKPGSRRKVS
jgi:hypothetical protein